MANTYSALKRVRQTERRTEYNRKNKTRLRHQIRAMRRALTGKDAKAAADTAARDVLADRPLGEERDHQEEHGGAVQVETAPAREGARRLVRRRARTGLPHQLQNELLHDDAVVRPRVAESPVRLEDQLHRALELRLA